MQVFPDEPYQINGYLSFQSGGSLYIEVLSRLYPYGILKFYVFDFMFFLTGMKKQFKSSKSNVRPSENVYCFFRRPPYLMIQGKFF